MKKVFTCSIAEAIVQLLQKPISEVDENDALKSVYVKFNFFKSPISLSEDYILEFVKGMLVLQT